MILILDVILPEHVIRFVLEQIVKQVGLLEEEEVYGLQVLEE